MYHLLSYFVMVTKKVLNSHVRSENGEIRQNFDRDLFITINFAIFPETRHPFCEKAIFQRVMALLKKVAGSLSLKEASATVELAGTSLRLEAP